MLNFTTWITRNCSSPPNLTLSSDLKIAYGCCQTDMDLINQKKEKKTDENLFICKIFLQLIMSTKWIWLLLLHSVLGNFNALTLHTTENCSWYTVTVNSFSIQPAYKYHKFHQDNWILITVIWCVSNYILFQKQNVPYTIFCRCTSATLGVIKF